MSKTTFVVAAVVLAFAVTSVHAQVQLVSTYLNSGSCSGSATQLTYSTPLSPSVCNPSACEGSDSISQSTSCPSTIPTSAPAGYSGEVYYYGPTCSGTAASATFVINSCHTLLTPENPTQTQCSGNTATTLTYPVSDSSCSGTPSSNFTFPVNTQACSDLISTNVCTSGADALGVSVFVSVVIVAAAIVSLF